MPRPGMHSATPNLDSLLHTQRFVQSIVYYALILSYVSPLSFDITYFEPSSNDIVYEGDARIANGAVDFTSVESGLVIRTGRIHYYKPVDLLDPSNGRQADFSTNFSFVIDTLDHNPPSGDGVVFFLVPVGSTTPINSAAGNLGVLNSTESSLASPIVMVEFDTCPNRGYDPPTPHIGINLNSLSSLVNVSWDPISHSGKTTNVLVTYNSSNKNFSAFWSFDNKPVSLDSFNSSISSQIDLAKVLPPSVQIGFSASYGPNQERHTLYSWGFSSNLDVVHPPSRHTNVTAAQARWEMHGLTILLTVGAACFLFSTIILGLCVFVGKRKKTELIRKHTSSATTDIDREIGSFPVKFSYQELSSATNGFAKDRRLGQGGSGQVYKGILSRLDRPVAVKRIFAESRQSEKVFINEIKIISHRDRARTLGLCRA